MDDEFTPVEKRKLEQAGLPVEHVVEVDDAAPEGVVIVQQPPPGEVEELRSVGLLVSRGAAGVDYVMPDLIGRPAGAIAGLIEVRGLGIMRLEYCSSAPLGLVVALDQPEARLPERMTHELLGVALPCVRLDPHAPSTCAKIKLALGAERVE